MSSVCRCDDSANVEFRGCGTVEASLEFFHHGGMAELRDEIRSNLQKSNSDLRKHWAKRIVDDGIPLISLMGILHGQGKTAQRFTWLIGDLVDIDPSVVKDCLPMLFEVRDDMPFPGMQRCVAKCLSYSGIPKEIENEAFQVLFAWMDDDEQEIGVKHHAAQLLVDLAVQERVNCKRVSRCLAKETQHSNNAHAGRMAKLLAKFQRTIRSD